MRVRTFSGNASSGRRGPLRLSVAALVGGILWAVGGPAVLAATVVRGPYLQLGTSDSVIVRWRTDGDTKRKVWYGPAPDNLNQNTKRPGSGTEHEIQLTNLSPGTRYYYAVGTDNEILAGGDASHFFETAPAVGTPQPTRVWVLGDSGTANANPMAVRDSYETFAGSQYTHLWLMLGDNAYANGTDLEYQAAVFDMFPQMLRQSVLWPALGNHDAASSSSSTQLGPYFDMFNLPAGAEAGGLASGTEAYYSFDYANIHFVVLDSQGSNRDPDGPMLTWLNNDLAATDQMWIIAYWHHSPYSKGHHDSDNTETDIELVEMRESAVPILENHGVDLVLTAHSHNYERSFLIDGHYGFSDTFGPEHVVNGGDGREDGDGAYRKPLLDGVPHKGTVYTVAGCSGNIITGGTLDHPAMFVAHLFLGSVVLDVNDDRLDATYLDWTGIERDHFTIIKDPDLVADFSADPLTGGAPLEVGFTDLSVSEPTEWAWDFDNDGFIDSTDQNPTHTYDQPGLYSVKLTVTGPAGVHEALKQDFVEAVLVPPVADFSATPLLGKAPVAVDFTDESGFLPDQWAWDFDDDGVVDSTEQHPTHVYEESGVYSVKLTASNAAGSDVEVKQDYVKVIADVPGEITGLVVGPAHSTLSWDAHPDACGYDVVKGDLAELRTTVGDYSLSQLDCLDSNIAATVSSDPALPLAAQLFFYLVRGVDCSLEAGTYDTSGLRQVETRDPELQGLSAVCGCQPADDLDVDGYCSVLDNCPGVANADQLDTESDGFGDACDNCPAILNPGQEDLDLDGSGNACDTDDDNDGILDESDLCPLDAANDGDGDGFCADVDNCPVIANAGQEDADIDGFGDVCDCNVLNPNCTSDCTDIDSDGFCVTTDCDDGSSVTFPGAAAEDSVDACMKDFDDDDWGDDSPPPGVVPGTDCDDADAAIRPDTIWYADVDGDGYGDAGSAQASCTQPEGFVADAMDCDDASPFTFPGAAPNDGLGICMKDADQDDWGDDSPPAGVTPGSDCDDGDATINPSTIWHADGDGDGYGDPGSTQASCSQPAGFVGDATDCDDASSATFPGAAPNDSESACMKDTDGDDWGDDNPPVLVTPGTDCNDGDGAINPETLWYADGDGDGFGDAETVLNSCLQPADFVLDATDCDDASPVTFPGAAPNDSTTECMKDLDGDDWGDDAPPNGVVSGTDCNDDDGAIHPETVWHKDEDGDGFGSPGSTVTSCSQPENHVLDGTDCRDKGGGAAQTFPGAAPKDSPTACMRDADGDDWGDDNPPGGVEAGTDCDDNNEAIGPDTVWHADTDGDGHGDPGSMETTCAQPEGFVLNDTDCDDTSPTAASTFPGAAANDSFSDCMKDADGDDWGDAAPLAGVTAGTDCDDTSATAAATFPGAAPNDDGAACMKDVDGDDWADATPPLGVTGGSDCDDASAMTFPGAAPNDSTTECMQDVDADDWGDETPPVGVTAGTDCDDGSSATFPGAAPNDSVAACMKDVDGDDWGDDSPPVGVASGTDCDDADAAINPDTVWYVDSDGDGYGDSGTTQVSCSQPEGFVADATDCDDAASGTFPGAAPNDSASDCMKDADEDDWGDESPPAGVVPGTDCDDDDGAINPDTLWYADTDGDGYGDPGSTQASCTQPAGFSPDATDCDDASSATFPGAAPNDSGSACMKDVDGDDWGDDGPPGGVDPGTDCDDDDAATNPDTEWYADSDGDGYGDAGSTLASCTQPAGFVSDATDCDDASSATFPGAAPNDSISECMKDLDGDDWGDDSPPVGVTPGTDCDDESSSTFPGAAPSDSASDCMRDADGDGWGDDSPPAGVTSGTDCNDGDGAINPHTVWYADTDGDGYGDAGSSQIVCTQPAGFVSDATDCDDGSSATFPGAAPNDSVSDCMKDSDGDDWGDDNPPVSAVPGTDCDDNDADTNPDTIWYEDSDGDGYGDLGSTQSSCTQPAGFVSDATDCDDGSSATFPGAAPNDSASDCMKDADGDDWGDDNPPAGVTPGTDCDDDDGTINPDTVWYADTDGDGYGNAGSTQVSCTQPVGFVSDATDCDDGSSATFPGAAPNDSVSACMKDTDGDDWGDDSPPVGVTPGTDCDDDDAATHPDTIWYADSDGDGFGDAASTQASCTQPAGFVSDATDCDDGSSSTFPGAAPNDSVSDCMKDADGDDWGDDDPPAGVTPGTDCDDGDAATHPNTVWYADSDGDGFGDAGSTQASCTQPAGFVSDATDCDDASSATFPGAAPNDSVSDCMKDADGDDWGDDSPHPSVSAGTDCDDDSPTAGSTFPGAAPLDSTGDCMKDVDGDDWGDANARPGVTDGTDCNDDDAAIHPNTTWYADDDGDGFGNPGDSLVQCAQPAGYVLDGTDCRDSGSGAAQTYPGAAPNDSATDCMQDVDGDDWGSDSPPGGVIAGTDCNDGDENVYPGQGCP